MKAVEIPIIMRGYFRALNMCVAADADGRHFLHFIFFNEEKMEFAATNGRSMLIYKPDINNTTHQFMDECSGIRFFEWLAPYRNHNLLIEYDSYMMYPDYWKVVPDKADTGYAEYVIESRGYLPGSDDHYKSGTVLLALGKAGIMMMQKNILALNSMPTMPSRILFSEDKSKAVRIDGDGYTFVAMPLCGSKEMER